MLIEDEALVSREAWEKAMGCSAAVHYKLQAYSAHTQIHDLRISSQETLTATLVAQVSSLQSRLIAALGQIQALQARDPTHVDDPEDADSCKRDTYRSRNGDDSHDSGSDKKRRMHVARECTYSDFLKCQPLISRVKGTDVESYTQHFQELALLCGRMFPDESDKVEKYVGGLPDMIQGSVMASKPKKMQDAIEFATELMDQNIHTLAERQAKNKRKFEDTSRSNQNQQQPFKRHIVARAYTAGPGNKKPYRGSKPLCPKCNYHHEGQCAPRCNKCKKVGHLARDCRGVAVNTNTQRGVTCYECRVQGHYKKHCPKLKNKNQGNQARNGNVVARAYGVGTTGTNPNSNVVTGTLLLNKRYASILFDTGADRSFVSTTFSSLIDIILTILNHRFNVDSMPVKLGSFDVIISIDWLIKYHAVIVCDEKLIRVPLGNKILIFCGEGSNNGHESWLNI
ncbi:putative reverse transcriptase domain-containing protein, partial [Tanacetum coccineum]